MRRKFYIRHGEFGNVYDLAYAESATDDANLRAIGFQPITRREALAYVKRENLRRIYNVMFAGYSDNCVWPAMRYLVATRSYDDARALVEKRYTLRGGIWESA